MDASSDLVEILRAAGETTRLRLLALLADGEQSVKDLTEILGQSQPRVSRHLKLLADAGLVRRHAEGAWAYYGLAEIGSGADLARWAVGRLNPDDPERQRDRARLADVRRTQQHLANAYFSKVAQSWDQLRQLHVSEEAVEAAVSLGFGAEQVDTFLDLGTGTGRMLELLAGKYRRGIGLDSSRDMLAVARAKLAAAGVSHAQVRLGDVLDLDPALPMADRILFHQVLHYFDDPGRVLQGAARLLKPAGELLVVDFAPHELEFLRSHHAHRRLGLSVGQMQAWARAAQLDIIDFTPFPPAGQPEGLTVCLWRLARGHKDMTT
jgi:ubiquinone/menaquinone biosynthesis C-methylase UbiE/DNA-binding transcriptional ArsR family regulator